MTFTEERVQAVVRFSKHDGPRHPCYGTPQEVTLVVQRRVQALKPDPANYIVLVYVADKQWAEYSAASWSAEAKEFMVEEYRMLIVSGWTPEGII